MHGKFPVPRLYPDLKPDNQIKISSRRKTIPPKNKRNNYTCLNTTISTNPLSKKFHLNKTKEGILRWRWWLWTVLRDLSWWCGWCRCRYRCRCWWILSSSSIPCFCYCQMKGKRGGWDHPPFQFPTSVSPSSTSLTERKWFYLRQSFLRYWRGEFWLSVKNTAWGRFNVFMNYYLDYVYLLSLVFSVLDQVLWVCSAPWQTPLPITVQKIGMNTVCAEL